jgi:hypothetical protein
MRGTTRLLVASSAAIIALVPPADGQVRAVTPIVPIVWKPMNALAPVSLAPGQRIVLGTEIWANTSQTYDVLEKLGAGTWVSWGERKLTNWCENVGPSGTPMLWCRGILGPISTTYAPAVEVRALIDLAGSNPSEIYTYQEVGTLAIPAISSPGMVQTLLQPGQSLRLLNDRILYQTPPHGWGGFSATDLVLYAGSIGGHVLGTWPQVQPIVVTDQSRRVAVLQLIGRHRADNWGVPKSVLYSVK